MPYHIFKIFPNKSTEYVDSHDSFKSAKTFIQNMRTKLVVADNYQIKMIFASNPQAGAKLIATEREIIPYGDD